MRGEPRPPVKDGLTWQPCGTNGAYNRHRRHGQEPCNACLRAHARDRNLRRLAQLRKDAGR